jgi:hypothetical protein
LVCVIIYIDLRPQTSDLTTQKIMSRILEQLKGHIFEGLTANGIDSEIVNHLIDEFAALEDKKYQALRKDKKFTFGKYRGYTVKELGITDKGKEYLSWILGQTWFVENNSHLVEEIKELGIKPKKFKRTPLE